MAVEFFGVNGFGRIGTTSKIDRSAKTGKTEDCKNSFVSTMQLAGSNQGVTDAADTSRSEKIQNIKEQVANGSYQPDLHQVASSLLKFLVEER